MEAIYQYQIENAPTFVFSETIASAIKQLWHDPIIATIIDRSSEFYLMDSAA
jgi:guanine nucleotide-binding protein subunit alpha